MTQSEEFIVNSDNKAFDRDHRKIINFNIAKYDAAVEKGKDQYCNHELARQRAAFLKTTSIENLDKMLIEFETNFTKNGGKVIWASDKEQALGEIAAIFEKKHAKSVVKSKSMTTEEIDLNEYLEHHGIEAVETDLGEYIVQLAGQKPYHIVTPAMHMSKKDVSELFHEKLKTPLTDDASELALTARKILRSKYTTADIGITGANFILPDIGGVAITENEGNGRLSFTFPKVHIAIVGIEKMIPTVDDLDLFWPLLSTSGTGQYITVYNSIITGPKKADETDGPEEMYVILLDNGRTTLMKEENKRNALNCIRCGACLNACPVYKNIGGHSYETTYSGPIGSIITPHLSGLQEYKHLSFASSLCGACTSVCPVKIDIHNILLLNRELSVKKNLTNKWEKLGFNWWVKGMKSRKLMNMAPAKLKQTFLGYIFKETWGKRRKIPLIAPRSFNQLWKDSHQND